MLAAFLAHHIRHGELAGEWVGVRHLKLHRLDSADARVHIAIDSHHVVAHCVAQLDVANGVVTNLQNGIFACCDGLAAHRVAQEQALVLIHLCEHIFHTVEGFKWGNHRLFVGFHHHLQATESHGAVHIQNTVFGGVGGGAAHVSIRGSGWGGDDIHCAHHVEDVHRIIAVHIGSLEDEGASRLLGDIVHLGHHVGNVHAHAAVSITLLCGKRSGSHHI